MDRDSGCGKRTLMGCGIIILGLIVCGLISTFTLDRLCVSTMTQRLPTYPGATVIAERHNMFDAYGMGETYVELYSPDAPVVVGRWYGETAGTYEFNAIKTGDTAYKLAKTTRSINHAADGTGSQIMLYGTCIN